MGEAAEIAKLRLFLKLVAQLDDVSQVEPLPDLDFNIKTGNLLVGIADPPDVARRFGDILQSFPGLAAAEQAARLAGDAYERFTAAQLSEGSAQGVSGKRRLSNQIQAATHQADNALFDMRGEVGSFEEWKKSHVPFHWFAEFPSVWRHGGFDVVVGNPPYINKKQVTEYTWRGYATEKCPDLYAVCMERASTLLNEQGRMAMIVRNTVCSAKRFLKMRCQMETRFPSIWLSSYGYPGRLFTPSADIRNTIFLGSVGSEPGLWTTRHQRHKTLMRSSIFFVISYLKPNGSLFKCGELPRWPFADDPQVAQTFATMIKQSPSMHLHLVSKQTSRVSLGYKDNALYQLGFYNNLPRDRMPDGRRQHSSHLKWLHFDNVTYRDLVMLIMNGRWGFLWWTLFGDDFMVTKEVIGGFPAGLEGLSNTKETAPLLHIARKLRREMKSRLAWVVHSGRLIPRYNFRKLRHITDEADWLLAQAWGLTREQYEAAGNLRDRMTFGSRG